MRVAVDGVEINEPRVTVVDIEPDVWLVDAAKPMVWSHRPCVAYARGEVDEQVAHNCLVVTPEQVETFGWWHLLAVGAGRYLA